VVPFSPFETLESKFLSVGNYVTELTKQFL
jgi:hypothetical protein